MSTNHERGQAGPASDDPAVVRAWRQASDEQPPERIDAAILAAARRSVEAQHPGALASPVPQRTRSRWMKWQPLAAAATVAGLAFVLVQTLPRERSDAGAARAPAAEAAPDIADTTRQTGTDPRERVMMEAPGNSASQEAAAPAARRTESFGLSTAAPPSAADWATRIEALHASGDLAAAAAALREFRAADPDADSYLPESLRDWARTVQ